MVKILVGNDFDEVLRTRSASAWWAQRVMWFADEGDIVVLPSHPERAFLRYVTSMTGARLESLRVLVPPADRDGAETLSGTSLSDERLLAEIRSAIAGRTITSILPLWPGAAIARLARALGVPGALPGHGFIEQGGGALMNSKTAFRAIAAGVGVPVPHGRVCAEEEDAVDAVCELVGAGRTAILKKDYMSGGAGNEIVSPAPGLTPVGAKKVVVASGKSAVRQYLSDRWDWLTDNRRNPFVVEQYFPDSTACFAEYLITDAGIEFGGHGEMLSEPVTTKQIIPPTEFSPEILSELTRQGRHLCEPLRAMGYRGRLSADAVITPDGELLFTEYNGRVTGSTHVYSVFGGKIVGRDFMKDRVLLEGFWPKGWSVPSFDSAVEILADAGLAYDRGSRSGVIISSAFDRRDDTLLHCVVAESLTAAYEVEKRLEQCFAGQDQATGSRCTP